MLRDRLESIYKEAMLVNAMYVGVLVDMEGFITPEVIINSNANFKDKLAYYLNTYDERLIHKYSSGVKIINVVYGNSYGEIEDLLFFPKLAADHREARAGKKDLGITEVRGAKANISDLVVYGDGDTFKLLCKASSKNQGWMKSTKVCNVAGGCVMQVTTQQENNDGSYSLAEAITFVPGNHIDTEAEPRKVKAMHEVNMVTNPRLDFKNPYPRNGRYD